MLALLLVILLLLLVFGGVGFASLGAMALSPVAVLLIVGLILYLAGGWNPRV